MLYGRKGVRRAGLDGQHRVQNQAPSKERQAKLIFFPNITIELMKMLTVERQQFKQHNSAICPDKCCQRSTATDAMAPSNAHLQGVSNMLLTEK